MPTANTNLLRTEPGSQITFACSKSFDAPPTIRTLKLSSIASCHVAYKVKTTAPKSYLVRPCSGVLPPNGSVDVQITLHSLNVDPTQDGPKDHRFLVQAIAVSTGDEVSREAWKELEADKGKVQEHRLKVLYESDEAQSDTILPSKTSYARERGDQDAPQDLKSKYDELVQYTLKLEKEKKQLEEQTANLGKTAASQKPGYQTIHLVVGALVGVIAAYATAQLM